MYKPNFTITHKILNALTEITDIKGIVERSRVLPLNEAQLKRQAIIRMVHTSTSIEGNKLAEYQVDRVLAGMSVSADQKSIIEVKNYQDALREVEKMSEKKTSLTLSIILNLHKILMKGLLEKEKIGKFRKGTIFVVDDLGDGREHLRFEGPDAKAVPILIRELLSWLTQADKDQLHPILKAGIFHLQLVSIHPFTDGNGRMARLLTTYILHRADWEFRKILVLEDYYNRDRLGYYNAENVVQGKKYQEGSDITSWLEYFVTGFLVEARIVKEKIQSIGFDKVSEESSQIYLDPDEIKIMDFLSTTGRLSSQDVMDVLKIAKRTAQLKLKNLVDKGLLKSQGAGPSTYYTLAQ